MNFKPELIEKILKGEKTQTRRLAGPRDFCLPGLHLAEIKAVVVEDGYRDNRHRVKWQIGRTYAICPGRGKQAVGRIKITGLRREPLRDISAQDAVAEGAPPQEQCDCYSEIQWFASVWSRIHTRPGTRWEDSPDVWVITFELAEAIEAVQR